MNRSILLLLLLLGGSAAALCQVPGYLGKKLTLQGEFHSFPAFDGPTANNNGLETRFNEEEGNFGLNWSAGLRLGYVTSRSKQIVLSLDYLKTGMIQTAYTPYNDFGSPGFYYHDLFYTLTSFRASIGTRKFKPYKGALAPMGIYNGWSIGAQYTKGNLKEELPEDLEHEPFGIEATHLMPVLGYDMGSNFIINDRFLLNVGAKINLPLSPRVYQNLFSDEDSFDPYNDFDGDYEKGNTDNFKTRAALRTAYHSVLMFYIGIGLLP